jgi:hypothetical protein
MNNAEGSRVAKPFCERLFAEDVITPGAVPYTLDYAVGELNKSVVPPARWATFVYMSA